jgi:hypothetical protein
METLDQYFKRCDTPMAHSPTGLAMVVLLEICPTIAFEEARDAVNAIGASAAQSPKECAKTAFRGIQGALAA